MGQFLGPDDQHHSESSVFLANSLDHVPIHYELVCMYTQYCSTLYIDGQHYSVLSNRSTDKHETGEMKL